MICRFFVGFFALVILAALVVFAVGHWGLFGQEPTPYAAIYLVMIAFPWPHLASLFLPEIIAKIMLFVGPFMTLALLRALCIAVNGRMTRA